MKYMGGFDTRAVGFAPACVACGQIERAHLLRDTQGWASANPPCAKYESPSNEGPLIIPACSDVEGMAAFLDSHPAWSPILDATGKQVGVEVSVYGWLVDPPESESPNQSGK